MTGQGNGAAVTCSECGTDYSRKPDRGGILLATGAVICPACSPRIEEDALRFNELKDIRARAEYEETFAAFVFRIRNNPPQVEPDTSPPIDV